MNVPQSVLDDINNNNVILKNSHLYGTGLLSSDAQNNDQVAELPPPSQLPYAISGYTLLIHFDYDSSAPIPTNNNRFFNIKQHDYGNPWNHNTYDGTYAMGDWANDDTGSIYMYCRNTLHTGSIYSVSQRNLSDNDPGGLGGYESSSTDPRFGMEQDNEFVFLFRSGEHGRGNNTSGFSLRIYKKSDFDLSTHIRDIDNIDSKIVPIYASVPTSDTLVTNRTEGIDLWLNGKNQNYSASNPQGVVDHGFTYKEVIWDYHCATDEQIEEYLVTIWPPPPPEPEPEALYLSLIHI